MVVVQAWFAQDEIEIRPGEATSLSLSIENLGERTESFTIIPAGATAAWTTVTRPNVTLFSGSRDVVEVVVRPPAVHTTAAGPTVAEVRVIPQADPELTLVAEAMLAVQPFDDRRITMLQPLKRGRRRATYELMVENHGNTLASCRLHLVDASNRVDGSFDPPAVGVAPGSSSLVRLRLRARSGLFRRTDRQLDFEIEATQPDHDPAIGRATLIQPPTIPVRFVTRLLALAALAAAIVAAWFAVVRPALRDAAEDAVDDRIAELAVPVTTGAPDDVDAPEGPASVSGPDASTPTTPSPSAPEDGEPLTTRIAVDVGVGATAANSFTVPAGATFQLRDLTVQNPNGDTGTAMLRRGADLLYTWDLATVGDNEYQPRQTPIPFPAGSQIVFEATCAGAGPASTTGCTPAVLIGGYLVPTG